MLDTILSKRFQHKRLGVRNIGGIPLLGAANPDVVLHERLEEAPGAPGIVKHKRARTSTWRIDSSHQ